MRRRARPTMASRARVAASCGRRAGRSWRRDRSAIGRPTRTARARFTIVLMHCRASILTFPDGRDLAYAEYGPPDGQPIVFFAGFGHDRFGCLPPGGSIRLVAVDRPGIGASSRQPERTIAGFAEDIEYLLDRLRIGVPALLSWSAGGPYALWIRELALTLSGGSTDPSRHRRPLVPAASARPWPPSGFGRPGHFGPGPRRRSVAAAYTDVAPELVVRNEFGRTSHPRGDILLLDLNCLAGPWKMMTYDDSGRDSRVRRYVSKLD